MREDGESGRQPPLRNRVTEILGVDYPIVQAPMGYIARAQLASAVSNAGALGTTWNTVMPASCSASV